MEYAWRVYVADELHLNAQDKTHALSWAEITNKKPAVEDGRSGDEIAASVIARAGISIEGGENL